MAREGRVTWGTPERVFKRFRGSTRQLLGESTCSQANDESRSDHYDDIYTQYGGGRSKVTCYGCGVALQTRNKDGSGFIAAEKFEEKARHKQFDQLLCSRCQDLSHGMMIPGVEDFAQKMVGLGNEKELLTPQQLRKDLGTQIKRSRSLIVLLVDLLDFSGSMLSNSVRDLVGGNPIIAVGTKMDLLPKQVAINSGDQEDEDAFFNWFEESLLFKKLSVISMHVVSSKTKQGIDEVVADIKKNRLGRDVYIIGAANVGKSAFVRAFVKEMSSMTSKQFDPLAIKKSRRLPVESSMPGTTLSSIPLEVFQSGEKLYDTPGLHIHHRLPHILTPQENKLLHPKKRLQTFVAKQVNNEPDHHTCYCWGGVVRVHLLDCPEHTSLTFFGPSDVLRVSILSFSTGTLKSMIRNSNEGVEKTDDFAIEKGFGAASVLSRGGLRIAKKASIKTNTPKNRLGSTDAVADIAISGIPGWIQISCPNSDQTNPQINLVIEAPVGIEVFVRPPIPLSSSRS